MDNIGAKWKRSIAKMSEDELWNILNYEDEYDSQIMDRVYSNSKKLFMPSSKETKDAIIKILNELKCTYENVDDIINFTYKDHMFALIIDEDCPFMQLLKTNIVTTKLDDFRKVAQLKCAINSANTNGHITVRYTLNDYAGELSVYGSTLILLAPFVPNRKEYLQFLLTTFLHVQKFLRREMLLKNEEQLDVFLN